MKSSANQNRRQSSSVVLAVVATLIAIGALWTLISQVAGQPKQVGTVPSVPGQVESGYPPPDATAPVLGQETQAPPTVLPDVGVRLTSLAELGAQEPALDFQAADTLRFANPSTDGTLVAGMRIQEGKPGNFGSVVTIDLSSGKAEVIAEVVDVVAPQVSEKYVVWADQGVLSVFDRSKGSTRTLDLKGLARDPSISGSVVVWESILEGQSSGLIAYDLATNEMWEVIASTPDAKAYHPRVSGSWVAFESWYFKDGQLTKTLRVASLKSRDAIDLGLLPGGEGYVPLLFNMSDPWIVWVDWGAGPGLHIYNVDTGEKREAKPKDCSMNGSAGFPGAVQVSSSLVVFDGCFQQLGYRIDRDEFFSLSILQESPQALLGQWALAKDRLIWTQLVPDEKTKRTVLFAAVIAVN